MTEALHATPETERELVMERRFDAPRALVWRAFTDPAHVPHWFGPKGFTITTHAIDVREGGGWHFVMHGPDGTDFDNHIAYREVAPIDRLVYDQGTSPADAPHFRVTVTFTDEAGGTRVRMRSLFPSTEAVEVVKGFGAEALGQTTFDKLGERLKAMALSLTRTFDAPRDVVFAAWSSPEALAAWWGPKGMTLDVLRHEFRPGGAFHFRMAGDGHELFGLMTYRDIEPTTRLSFTNGFADPEGRLAPAPFDPDFPREYLCLVTFTETAGKTTVNFASGPVDPTPASLAAYEAMVPGMEQGFGNTFDQLEAYLAR